MPKKKTSNRGGARPGAGRKPLATDQLTPTYPVTLRLSAEARDDLLAATRGVGSTQPVAVAKALREFVLRNGYAE